MITLDEEEDPCLVYRRGLSGGDRKASKMAKPLLRGIKTLERNQRLED